MNDLVKWLASLTPRERRKAIEARERRRESKSIADRAHKFREEELMAEYGAGTWVTVDEMNPMTNIANRLYKTESGAVRRFYAAGFEREKSWRGISQNDKG